LESNISPRAIFAVKNKCYFMEAKNIYLADFDTNGAVSKVFDGEHFRLRNSLDDMTVVWKEERPYLFALDNVVSPKYGITFELYDDGSVKFISVVRIGSAVNTSYHQCVSYNDIVYIRGTYTVMFGPGQILPAVRVGYTPPKDDQDPGIEEAESRPPMALAHQESDIREHFGNSNYIASPEDYLCSTKLHEYWTDLMVHKKHLFIAAGRNGIFYCTASDQIGDNLKNFSIALPLSGYSFCANKLLSDNKELLIYVVGRIYKPDPHPSTDEQKMENYLSDQAIVALEFHPESYNMTYLWGCKLVGGCALFQGQLQE